MPKKQDYVGADNDFTFWIYSFVGVYRVWAAFAAAVAIFGTSTFTYHIRIIEKIDIYWPISYS